MDTQKTMYDFLCKELQDNDGEKIYYYGNRISGQKLLRDIDATATFLRLAGIGQGDAVGICLPNIPQAAISFYAVNKIGAIANVMHPKIGAESLVEIIEQTNTKAVFLFDRYLKPHIDALTKMNVLIIDCRMSDYLRGAKKLFRLTEPWIRDSYVKSYKQALKEGGEHVGHADCVDAQPETELKKRRATADGEDAAVYLHSSGTTGNPKTVILSSRAFNELAVNIFTVVKDSCTLSKKFAMLMILPLFHGFGLGVCVHLGLWKARVVMVPIFRAKSTVHLMKKERIECVAGVPGMFRKLEREKHFTGDFLADLQILFCGGDKLDPKIKKAFEDKIIANGGRAKIMEGYGLSEVGSVTTINVTAPDNGSLGRPIDKVDILIADGDRILPEGSDGEIFVQSPSIMNGYLGGEETHFFNINGKKYLGSGDIGYLQDGYLYFKERIKRIVKIGGVNVFPQEVETVALDYPGVKQACAVRKSEGGKSYLKLIVALQDGTTFDDKFKHGICEQIKNRLMPYAVPRVVEKVPFVRSNLLGKADYRFYEDN